MKIYLKFLAAFYFLGFLLHVADVFSLRLNFSELSLFWKCWIIYLGLMDLGAAVGLWLEHRLGVILFFTVALSELLAYIGFKSFFGDQVSLIFFHFITLGTYLALFKSYSAAPGTPRK